MERSDSQCLDLLSDILSGQHSGVGGGLVSVGLDLHTTGDAAQSFTPGKISNMDEGVVEGRINVSDTEN